MGKGARLIGFSSLQVVTVNLKVCERLGRRGGILSDCKVCSLLTLRSSEGSGTGRHHRTVAHTSQCNALPWLCQRCSRFASSLKGSRAALVAVMVVAGESAEVAVMVVEAAVSAVREAPKAAQPRDSCSSGES